jgi:hypothetical protein
MHFTVAFDPQVIPRALLGDQKESCRAGQAIGTYALTLIADLNRKCPHVSDRP